MKIYRAVIVSLCLATAACVGGGDDESEQVEQGEDALRHSDVEHFTIRQTTGFVAPSPAGSCRDSGAWNVSFQQRHIRGQGCVDGRPSTVDRDLSGDELMLVRKAVFKVKSGRRPASCPTDAPATYLDVVRETREDHYVVEREACRSASPVTAESLGALLDVVKKLAAPASTEAR